MSRGRACFLLFLVLTAVLVTSPARAGTAPCKPFVPNRALVDGNGESQKESLKAPVIKVSDSATQTRPVVRRFTYGPSFHLWTAGLPIYAAPDIGDPHKYFNFQVTTSKPARGLYIRVDWPPVSVTDIDLGLYNAKGKSVGFSDATNAFPPGMENVVFDPIFGPREIRGGPGYESILGVSAQRCAGFMLHSYAYETLGEEVRLTAWLGKIRPQVY